MTTANQTYQRKLRHSIEFCFMQNFVSVKPTGGDDTPTIQAAIDKAAKILDGDERRCRCGRTWRVEKGLWKLVVQQG